jgi:hypothetical protein
MQGILAEGRTELRAFVPRQDERQKNILKMIMVPTLVVRWAHGSHPVLNLGRFKLAASQDIRSW